MEIKYVDTVEDYTNYSIELSNAEDVAENGEKANFLKFSLPSHFDPNHNGHWNTIVSKLQDQIAENNFDTIILTEETCKEKLYLIEINT